MAIGAAFGGRQTAQLWPLPVSGARSIGAVKNNPAPLKPSPPKTRPYGLRTAGVLFGSATGIVGFPTSATATSTVIVPLGPGVNVPVVLCVVPLTNPDEPSHCPYVYEVPAGSG